MPDCFGSFCLILHGHIPYVLGHGTWPHGSQMIYEAAADTYIPILQVVEKLADEGIAANIAIGLTPVTMEQLADERFKDWFPHYLQQKAQAGEQNFHEFNARGDLHLAYLARRWHDHYSWLSRKFCEEYNRDILGAFRKQQEAGNIEVISSAATHGYLPLLREDASVQAQIMQGADVYERHMGCRPRGCWLPECAYRPRSHWAPQPFTTGEEIPYPRKGIEEFLGENGYDYFIVDNHMLEKAGDPLPVRIEETDTLGKLWGQIRRVGGGASDFKTPYRPYFIGDHFEDHPPVAALFRDPQTSHQVWSGADGYPGDHKYLEFHKKHQPGDLRYWAVTDDAGDLASKQPWSPDDAGQKAGEHAGHFLWMVKNALRHAYTGSGPQPVLISPFDAELFGHWWHEGTWWLEKALRWMNLDPEVNVSTPHSYLAANTPEEAITLPEGSWGAGGGHSVWLNDDTVWTWRHIYNAELNIRNLIQEFGAGHDEPSRDLIKQACRELLLLQASDWQFLMTTGSASDYAAARLQSHYDDMKRCAQMARRYCRGEWIPLWQWQEFGEIQHRDSIFADIDPLWFGAVKNPAT